MLCGSDATRASNEMKISADAIMMSLKKVESYKSVNMKVKGSVWLIPKDFVSLVVAPTVESLGLFT